MNSPDMIELKNKFIIGLVIAIIIAIPIGILFFNKLSNFNSEVYNELRNKKTFLLFLTSSDDCSKCSDISEFLEDSNVSYYQYDVVKENDYADILNILGLDEDLVTVPALIYVKNGQMEVNMMKVESTDMVLDFLEFYKLN